MSTDSPEYQEVKQKYKPRLTSIPDIYQNPLHKPLATVMATIVLFTMGYQVVQIFQQHGAAVGLVAAVTVYGAYRLAKLGWEYQNEFVASRLAQAEVDPEQESPDISSTGCSD